MPRIIKGLSPWGGPTRIFGVAHTYYSPRWQRWITRSWPKGQGADTPARARSRATFTAITKLIKSLPPEEREAAVNLASGTPYLPRDLHMKAATGTLIEFRDQNGKLWMSTRVAIQNIQPMLDSIGFQPGSMLVRLADYWAAIEPPLDNAVLLWDQAGLSAAWTPFDTAIDAMLDTLTTEQGSILFRNATEWVALAPGVEGQVLSTNDVGADPSWIDQGGGGGGGGISPWYQPNSLVPPAIANFTLTPAAGITATLVDMNLSRGMTLGVVGSGSSSMAAALQPVPSQTAFTALMLSNLAGLPADINFAAGIAVTDSAGHVDVLGGRNAGSNMEFSTIFNFSAMGNFSGQTNDTDFRWPVQIPVWTKVDLAGGIFSLSLSIDGEKFYPAFTQAVNVNLTLPLASIGPALFMNVAGLSNQLNVYSWTCV